MVQTAVADPTSVEGALIRGPYPEEIISRVCEGALQAGRLVKFGTDPSQQVLEPPALPAADVDAIAATVASATSAQSLTGAALDGVIGFDRIAPCRTPTVVFDADAGWDIAAGVDVTWYGYDALGAQVQATVNKATGTGAVTLTAPLAFAAIVEVTISAGGAATGSATLGLSNDKVEISPADYPGLAVYRPIKEPNTTARNFAQYEDVDILMRGRMMCVPEHAVSQGDQVYVRVLESGSDLRGQLTGQDGSATPATYAKLAGAKWVSAAAADGYAIVELAGV